MAEIPLKEQMLRRIRATGRSDETFKTYWGWCERYFRFVASQAGFWKHPKDCGRAGIDKRITSHCLRHSAATHASEMGVDIRTIQQLMGHSDIRTTEIYIHANQHKATASRNPLQELMASEIVSVPFRRMA